jgi:serine/threonine-protein kinase
MSSPGGTLTGREIAGYRLLHVLGVGGASEVYLAQRLEDPAVLVAMKVLMPSWQLPPDERKNFYARFLREAQAAQRLQHPHILTVLAFGEEGDITYMVLPVMAGGTLATRLANAPRGLPLEEAARYMEQLAGALDFAHAQGIIHRDIKPTNVLMDTQGQLFLGDFGIARLFRPAETDAARAGGQPLTTLTVTGQVLGTPIYMAPEQLVSTRVGPTADIYSLGILLYQIVTGAVPFQAETPVGLAMQHVQEPPAAPHLRRADLPEPAEAAILKALAKTPEARFTSARALARAFAAGIRGEWTEGLAPTLGAQVTRGPASTMVATPPPTIVATPAPSPYSAGAIPYFTPGAFSLPARPRRSATPIVLAVVALVLVVAGIFGAQVLASQSGGATSGASHRAIPLRRHRLIPYPLHCLRSSHSISSTTTTPRLAIQRPPRSPTVM